MEISRIEEKTLEGLERTMPGKKFHNIELFESYSREGCR
jgi:hypothetical protein